MSKVAAILRAHELARAQKVRRKHTHVETISEDDRSAREYAAFQHDCFMDEFNDIPDRLGKTGNYEPASIYSPAPPSRFKVERPAKRKSAERNQRDCELPADPRKRQTVTLVNDRGHVTGSVSLNPFTKRMTISIGG
jgi:hypothetical protein